MRFRLKVIAAALAAVSIATSAHASGPISRSQLEQMFSQIATGSGWDLSKPLLWGYFFLSPNRAALETAGKHLVSQGYRLVGIEPIEMGAARMWKLHVERVEIHTVDTLDQRNQEFYAFVKSQGLAAYDGMDVGPAP